ncbi:hypothetical protein L210DRAFT_3560595 [Boletus edulis BED1]|uniref:Uncharacterized protein n=1 Tax=Boletus edulis BED1 TaxID=1328754 RepID=A0AAD4BGL7_BOLED|nr:hypothetical protein L210DRAFT_3565075 [Boletus edulis BED1]KAF8431274.1 hypothetical protein L210DRAFT_3560595 [Boletus edulis BED1]
MVSRIAVAWPFESAFTLYDGHFTIQRIIRCGLKNPEFAYLLVCHTTVGNQSIIPGARRRR